MTFLCVQCGKPLDDNNFYKKVKNKSKDGLNEKLNCQLCEKYFTETWLTTHMEREHHQSESNSCVLEKLKKTIMVIL